MKTAKFEATYYSARYIVGSEIEMQAKVRTDHASHYCRVRMDKNGLDRGVWADMGRVYTPDQNEYVRQLLRYRLSDVKAALTAYLKQHSLGVLFDEQRIDIRLDEKLEIVHMSFERTL